MKKLFVTILLILVAMPSTASFECLWDIVTSSTRIYVDSHDVWQQIPAPQMENITGVITLVPDRDYEFYFNGVLTATDASGNFSIDTFVSTDVDYQLLVIDLTMGLDVECWMQFEVGCSAPRPTNIGSYLRLRKLSIDDMTGEAYWIGADPLIGMEQFILYQSLSPLEIDYVEETSTTLYSDYVDLSDGSKLTFYDVRKINECGNVSDD